MEKNSWDTGWYIVHQKQQFTASDGDSSLIKQIHTGSHGFKTVEIKSKGIRKHETTVVYENNYSVEGIEN